MHQHHYSSYVLIYAFYAFLILSLPSIGERAGIKILRYDFSDPQAGKHVWYLRIATLKSQSCKRGLLCHCCRNSRFFSKYDET